MRINVLCNCYYVVLLFVGEFMVVVDNKVEIIIYIWFIIVFIDYGWW